MKWIWKAAAAVFCVSTLVLAGIVYKKPVDSVYRLDAAPLFADGQLIRQSTGATVLAVWEVDTQSNSRIVIYVDGPQGPVADLMGFTAPLFDSNTINNTYMANLHDGKLRCGQINTRSKMGLYVTSVGAPNICRAGIIKDGMLIGYVSLSYPEVPAADDMDALNAIAAEVARKVIRK